MMFLSRATNTLDSKGRISVPADFRMAVSASGFAGIVVWRSFDGPFIHGGGMDLMREYQAVASAMDPFDDVRIAFERSIFAESVPLTFDSTGRVSLPKHLAEHAGLDGKATFVGLGNRFEIWAPEAYEAQAEQARALTAQSKDKLKLPGRI